MGDSYLPPARFYEYLAEYLSSDSYGEVLVQELGLGTKPYCKS